MTVDYQKALKVEAHCGIHEKGVKWRIGYVFVARKRMKSGLVGFDNVVRPFGIDVKCIDLESETGVQEQVPFHLILHKLTDVLQLAKDGDSKAVTQLRRFQDLMQKNANLGIKCVDPIESLDGVMSRYRMNEILAKCFNNNQLLDRNGNPMKHPFRIPTYTFWSMADESSTKMTHNLGFPVIGKPVKACASKWSHQLFIAYTPSQLPKRLDLSGTAFSNVDDDWILQSFVPHNSILFKVYAIGPDDFHIVPRPSIHDMDTCTKRDSCVWFNSQAMPKSFNQTKGSGFVDPIIRDLCYPLTGNGVEWSNCLDRNYVRQLVRCISSEFGFRLFGFDLLLVRNTQPGPAFLYYVIDVNYFPGYAGVPNFQERLFKFLQKDMKM